MLVNSVFILYMHVYDIIHVALDYILVHKFHMYVSLGRIAPGLHSYPILLPTIP